MLLPKVHRSTCFVQNPGPSGFMGYGDLWGFISQNSFILNPCLDLWGFMGIYG